MAVLHSKTKLWERVGTELRVQMWQRQLISSMFISRKWEYNPIRQFKLSALLCILCKCNCRRSSSHCKSATQFAPQKCFSLITEKFPKEEGGQWPTWVTHFAKVTYLCHVLDCSIVPPCADWGSAAIGLSPREAETWNSLAHTLTEFRIGKRILVDDLRSFRRRRSKHNVSGACRKGTRYPIPVNSRTARKYTDITYIYVLSVNQVILCQQK